jgi:hypothetical protein
LLPNIGGNCVVFKINRQDHAGNCICASPAPVYGRVPEWPFGFFGCLFACHADVFQQGLVEPAQGTLLPPERGKPEDRANNRTVAQPAAVASYAGADGCGHGFGSFDLVMI